MILLEIFVESIGKGTKTTPRDAKSEKMDPKVSKSEPKGAKSEPKGAKREPKGAKREPKGAKMEPKVSQRATKMHLKIRRPLVGRVRVLETKGEFTSPYPLRPGPPPAEVWSQFVYSDSLNILGPYFDPEGPNPATRGLR